MVSATVQTAWHCITALAMLMQLCERETSEVM